MSDQWKKDFENIGKGPKPARKVIWKWMLVGIPLLLVIIIGGFVFSTCAGLIGETVQVAREEFGPRELLRKYEWFKDTLAQLDKKTADINVYETRTKNMHKEYEGTKRKDWDRTDKEQFNQWNMEVAGVKASYNGLAAEYNSQMAKFNWRFTNAGDLPQGADKVLPREVRQYISE